MSLAQASRRTDMLLDLIGNLKKTISAAPTERTELSEQDVKDCWAVLLAVSRGGDLESFAQQQPEVFARLQERFLTESELTAVRLANLPFG